MKDKSKYYHEQTIKSIVFTYAVRDGKALPKTFITNIQYHNYQHHNLPITMNPLEYGKLLVKFEDTYIIQVNDKNVAIIRHKDTENQVKFYKSGELTYQYIDKKVDETTFIRSIGKKEYIFKNNELILFKVEKQSKFIKPLISSDCLVNKFLTMDIETYVKNDIHIPYAISVYDGDIFYSYYTLDYTSTENMIKDSILNLMCKKYDNYSVYIHNLSGFDGIFLLKILTEIGIVNPVIHNDKIISIMFKYKDYIITLKDSNQLLLDSLRKLAKCFNVDTQKSIFPYSFVNENNLDYIGTIPDFKYFDGISSLDYNCYIENYNI
jgi:hypothetical protein